jgi:hypothetical protein
MKDKQGSKDYHKAYYKMNKEAIKQRRLETAKRQQATSTAAKDWKLKNINNPHIFSPFYGQIPPRFPNSHSHDLIFQKDTIMPLERGD